MKNLFFICFSLVLLNGGCDFKPPVANPNLFVGVARIDITPAIGYPVHNKLSDGIHDPLEAKAIVLKQDDCHAALIMADLFYIPLALSKLVRNLVSEKTGIPVPNICLAATHTHSDPTCYTEIELYIQRMDSGKLSKQDENTYAGLLIHKLVNSVVEAQANLKLASLKTGVANIDGVSFNRRHLMKDGTVRMNGGFLNPDIIRSVGPVDPELGIVLFNDETSDKPFASFLTFAMQLASIDDTKFSSGYPYFLEKELQNYFGEGYMSVFGEGPCADVNHFDVTKPGPQMGYENVTQPIGKKLAVGFLPKLPELKKSRATLAVISKVVEVPLQTYSDMDLEWARSYKDSLGSPVVMARVRKILTLERLQQKYGDTLPLEVQVFCVNQGTAIVALPGQIFVELGLAIKKSSPFTTTLIVTLANSHEECIPLKKAFAEGSYEIVYSLVDSRGGEMLVETALSLMTEIKNKY